jgi:hypothetical protein
VGCKQDSGRDCECWPPGKEHLDLFFPLHPDLRALHWPWFCDHQYRPPLLPGMRRRNTGLDPDKLAADVRGRRARRCGIPCLGAVTYDDSPMHHLARYWPAPHGWTILYLDWHGTDQDYGRG